MNNKTKIKLFIDILMTLALLFLMGYQLFQKSLHEYIGLSMFLLFIIHHIINFNWHRNILKGKMKKQRLFMFFINLFLLFCILSLSFTGISMSRYILPSLTFKNNLLIMRRVHILCAFWGFVFISIHIGINLKTIYLSLKEHLARFPILGILSKIFNVIIPIYGIFAFFKKDLLSYLLLKSEFVFYDFSETILLFYLDYISIMGLYIFIGYFIFEKLKQNKKAE